MRSLRDLKLSIQQYLEDHRPINSETAWSFTWTIENFSMLPHQEDEHLESSNFTVEFWKDVEFNLWLYPRGIKQEEGLKCYLFSDTAPFEVDLEFSFLSMTLESTVPVTKMDEERRNFLFDRGFAWAKFSTPTGYALKDLHFPQDILIIRCDFKLSGKCATNVENDGMKSLLNFWSNCCVCHTHFPIYRGSITWSIHDVNKQLEQKRNISIGIHSSSKASPIFNLLLILHKNSVEDCLKIEIKQNDLSSAKDLFVKCKLTVATAREKFQDSKESTHLFRLKHGKKWKFPAFIKTSNLTCKKYLLVDNTLLLHCDFTFTYSNTEQHFKEKFFDVQLKADGKIFPFYKPVLRARSPVFNAMFEHDMMEKNSSVVEIKDVEPDTLQRMLTFMYTDVKEELSFEDAVKLYIAADKYDVASLRSHCSRILKSSLTLNTADVIVLLAYTYHDNFLRNAVENAFFNRPLRWRLW